MNATADPLSTLFAALADPTRRAILARLARGDAPVSELAQPFAMSAPAVSRHLRVLTKAGLVEREVQARWRICRLRGEELRLAHDWLDQYRDYWERSLDQLVEFLERDLAAPAPARAPAKRRRTGATPLATATRKKRRKP